LWENLPIYKISMEEARWGAVFPDNSTPVFKIEGKCSCFGDVPLLISLVNPS
jgi:hypothetical protein